MGDSTDDMVNALQAQLAQGQQPSLFGVTAPPDPTGLAALLMKLQLQQYLAKVGQTGGQYGYLHDAGQQALTSVGQQLGSAGAGALMQSGAPQGPQPPTPQAQMSGAIQQAQKAYQAQIAAGVDENTARTNATKMMVAAGVPGAADVLAKANATGVDTAAKQAETAKNTSQSNMDNSDITKNDIENKSKQWTTTSTDPSGLFMLQTNGVGETRRVELKPPPSQAAINAANMDPNSIQFAADTYRTTGKFPGSFGRSPAMMQAVLAQVAKDAAANGDTAGSIQARSASLKAGGTALDQVTKQEAFTGSAVQTLDKNLQALQTIGAKVDSTGSPIINKVINHFNQGVVSDPDTASYVAMLNAVQGEYAKIASNNNGNSPISDSAKADAKDVINKAMSQGGIAGVRQAMMQEAQNRMQAIKEAKDGLTNSLSGNAPGAPQNAPPATVTPPAQTKPKLVYDPATGTFH